MDYTSFIQIFASPTAKFIGIPIITIVVDAVIKVSCTKDVSFDRNLFYWGPTLETSAVLLLFTEFCRIASDVKDAADTSMLTPVFLGVFLTFMVVIFTTLYVRKKGWVDCEMENKQKMLSIVHGIIVPNLVGMVLLFIILLML